MFKEKHIFVRPETKGEQKYIKEYFEHPLTRAYRTNHELNYHQKLPDGFIDAGRLSSYREILRVSFLDDDRLARFLDFVKRRIAKVGEKEDIATCVMVISLAISEVFGGFAPSLEDNVRALCKSLEYRRRGIQCAPVNLGHLMGGRALGISERQGAGVSRHRAIAFKAICDRLGICRAKLVRGLHDSSEHAWNIVEVDGADFLVDLMLEPGALYSQGSEEYKQYASLGALNNGSSSLLSDHRARQNKPSIVKRPAWYITDAALSSPGTLIAGGGFSIVYHKKWRGQQVAQKCMHMQCRALDFIIEISNMMHLQHNNVLQCLGGCAGIQNQVWSLMLLTPWMVHGNLHKAMKEKVCLCAVDLMFGMARGLAYLHGESVVHFDVKPHNVVLDVDFTPKIADSGISRLKTTFGGKLESVPDACTPLYAAPEQILNELCTEKVDVYAYGLIAYELNHPDHESAYSDSLNMASQKVAGRLPLWPTGDPIWQDRFQAQCSLSPDSRPMMQDVLFSLAPEYLSHDRPVLACWYGGAFDEEEGRLLMKDTCDVAKQAGIQDTVILHHPDAYGFLGEGPALYTEYIDFLVSYIDANFEGRPLLLLGHGRGVFHAMSVATRLGNRVLKVYTIGIPAIMQNQPVTLETTSKWLKSGGDELLLQLLAYLDPNHVVFSRALRLLVEDPNLFCQTLESPWLKKKLDLARIHYRDAIYPEMGTHISTITAPLMAICAVEDTDGHTEDYAAWRQMTTAGYEFRTIADGKVDCLKPSFHGIERKFELGDILLVDMNKLRRVY